MKQTRRRSGFALSDLIVLLLTMALVGGCLVSTIFAGPQRRGSQEQGDPTVTWEELEGVYEALPWSGQPVPVDGVAPVAVASPERLQIAGAVFASLLNDPSWRAQYESLFQSFMSWNYERDVARAMVDTMAAQRALTFTDALIEAAGGS